MPQLRAQSITHHLALIKSKLKQLALFEEQLNSQKKSWQIWDLGINITRQQVQKFAFQLTWLMNIPAEDHSLTVFFLFHGTFLSKAADTVWEKIQKYNERYKRWRNKQK